MTASTRKAEWTDGLHRARLFAGAARYIAERALQEPAVQAQRTRVYIEVLMEAVEEELRKLLSEER